MRRADAVELLRQRRDAQLVAIAVQHPQHERVAADELCRASPVRGSPSTEAIGVFSSTTGMWHDWQLFSSAMKALCRHSRYITCSGSSPIDLAAWAERLRDERVTRRAQLRLPDVRATRSA